MNGHASPMSFVDSERSSSPKRKRLRQKYAPKACVSCRRSKLKCTGENPCQRCTGNGKRCFYSEDQTAAEVLQNLSRPTPTSAPQSTTSDGNDRDVSHQSLFPPADSLMRRGSDAGNVPPTMEERMTKMERMMDILMQDRGLGLSASGSMERGQSVGPRSETAFLMPILDPIHPALDQMVQPSPEHLDASLPGAPAIASDTIVSITVGKQSVPFPDPARYEQYLAQFFGDFHLRHPCVDRLHLRSQIELIITYGTLSPDEVHILALHYIIFACCDIVMSRPPDPGDKLPGWQWYQLADSIVDKTQMFQEHDDMTVIQYLLFQSLYLAYADIPALAYVAIRATCTAVLQQNLHREASWRQFQGRTNPLWRKLLFWNVYLADRTISMSCDRPTSLHWDDICVETPEKEWEKIQSCKKILHDRQWNEPILYLKYEMLSAELVTKIFQRTHIEIDERGEITAVLADILGCCDTNIPCTFASLVEKEHMSYSILETFSVLRRLTAPLIMGRRLMATFNFDLDNTKHTITLASHALKIISTISKESAVPTSCRHQIVSTLAGLIIIFAALLLRQDITEDDRKSLDFNYTDYFEKFTTAMTLLSDLAKELPYAKRLHSRFAHFHVVILDMAKTWRSFTQIQSQCNPQEWHAVANGIRKRVPLLCYPFREICPPLQRRDGLDDWEYHCEVLWWF